jgi:uncharacterized protein (DUF1778 family)
LVIIKRLRTKYIILLNLINYLRFILSLNGHCSYVRIISVYLEMEKQLIVGKARFDAKIPKVQKEFFEYAATLGGFRTLTDFIINAVQEKANIIIQEHNTIIASEKDQEIFFNALMNPTGPNSKLRDAAERYKLFVQENNER